MIVDLTFRDPNKYDLIHVGGGFSDGCLDLHTDSLSSYVECSLEYSMNGYDEDVFNIHFNDLNGVKWMAQITFVPDDVGDDHALKILIQTTDDWDTLATAMSKMDVDEDEDEDEGEDEGDDYEPEPILVSLDEKCNFKDCIDLFSDDDSSAGGGTPLYGPIDPTEGPIESSVDESEESCLLTLEGISLA